MSDVALTEQQARSLRAVWDYLNICGMSETNDEDDETVITVWPDGEEPLYTHRISDKEWNEIESILPPSPRHVRG